MGKTKRLRKGLLQHRMLHKIVFGRFVLPSDLLSSLFQVRGGHLFITAPPPFMVTVLAADALLIALSDTLTLAAPHITTQQPIQAQALQTSSKISSGASSR